MLTLSETDGYYIWPEGVSKDFPAELPSMPK